MITTTEVASNGSQTTQEANITTDQPERVSGMARVYEAETYHAASVMHEAVSEAERLCSAVYRAVSDAYFKDVRGGPHNGQAAT